ncbi:DEAD/DEAH box helicase family protein [bacterium]|nr:DEAD/DEAH box helicase family protein [bacterium]
MVAPPGFGKTLIALDLITQKKKKSLIVIHRTQLLQQRISKIETFLHIPRKEIGIIDGKNFQI